MFQRFRSICLALILPIAGNAQSVLTANYDNLRTNSNLSETILTPGNVGPSSFGKLFTLAVDGQIYAQPLFVPRLSIAGAAHNVVFLATMHNSVYAFDADAASTPIWTVNLGPSIPASTFDTAGGPFTDIENEIGILGTPVIDSVTGTLYAIAGTLENGGVIYRLHALDVTSGAERFGAPVAISGHVIGIGDNSVNGVVTFDASMHLQRPGLALAGGIVYAGFGSHADNPPFHGWLFAYSAADVQNQIAVFNPTPNGSGGAFWQSGRAPAIDASGNLVIVSGNGDTDGVTSFSDSVLKLNPNSLTLTDWFAPDNVQDLNDNDNDLGCMGPILIPNSDYLVTGGKEGMLYVLKQSSLGNLTASDSQVPQEFQAVDFGLFNAALWARADGVTLYFQGPNGPVEAHAFTGQSFDTQASSTSQVWFNIPAHGMVISANGSRHGTGVVWTITADSYPPPTTATLRAYNADDLTAELWDSNLNPADQFGQFVKFVNPTVANGKVYAPNGSNQLVVYGLTPAASTAPVVTGITNAASYAQGTISPGEILAIFGENLGPAALVMGQWSPNNILADQAGGVEVTFNGIAAPILYASANQVAAITPYEIAGSSQVSIQVGVNGVMSQAQSVSIAPAAPGLFSLDASGSGPGAFLNLDYSVNSAANPAAAGSIVILYATGGGMTDGHNAAGQVAAEAASLTTQPVSVTIGGQPASVLYAGAAPGEANGVVQVNVQLPANITGTLPVVLTIGGAVSQATVTVAVR